MTQEIDLSREHARGSMVYAVGESGPLWRVTQGWSRFRPMRLHAAGWCSLPLPATWSGSSPYALEARALTACRLEQVEPQSECDRSLLMRCHLSDYRSVLAFQGSSRKLQPGMAIKIPPHPLVRKLAWAIVIKLLLLTAIWWAFLADQKVEVDAEQASRHLLMHPITDSNKEQGHDF